jgi:hypothetical protein
MSIRNVSILSCLFGMTAASFAQVSVCGSCTAGTASMSMSVTQSSPFNPGALPDTTADCTVDLFSYADSVAAFDLECVL